MCSEAPKNVLKVHVRSSYLHKVEDEKNIRHTRDKYAAVGCRTSLLTPMGACTSNKGHLPGLGRVATAHDEDALLEKFE